MSLRGTSIPHRVTNLQGPTAELDGLAPAPSSRAPAALPVATPAVHASHESLAQTARGLWKDDRLEVVTAILLALAAVLSAWGAYQATRWSGDESAHYAASSALRTQATQHAAVASRQIQVDVATFIAWSNAKAAADTRLADFLRTRFRTEFRPAFDTWLATALPDAQGLPAGTPFEQPTYALAELKAADALNSQADAALSAAQYANDVGDQFVLTAVLFASVLFFAGTAQKFRPHVLRWSMIGVALFVFGAGLVVEFSLPQIV